MNCVGDTRISAAKALLAKMLVWRPGIDHSIENLLHTHPVLGNGANATFREAGHMADSNQAVDLRMHRLCMHN